MAGMVRPQGYEFDSRTGSYIPSTAPSWMANLSPNLSGGVVDQREASLRNTGIQTTRDQANAQAVGSAYTMPNVSGTYGSTGSNTGINGGRVGGSMPVQTGSYGNPGPSGQIVTSTGAGGGDINLSREAYERQQEMALKKKYADEAFGKISGMSSGGAGGHVEYGGGAAGEAARAAAFARAKEQAGANAQAALKSMGDIMSRRGLSGSSIQAGAEGDIIQGGGTDIANVITDQMGDELGNVRHINDMTYQGGITQRGQDAQARQAYLSLLTNLY